MLKWLLILTGPKFPGLCDNHESGEKDEKEAVLAEISIVNKSAESVPFVVQQNSHKGMT